MTRTLLYTAAMAAVATAAAATFLYKAATVDLELSHERAAKVRAWNERDSIKAEADSIKARSRWFLSDLARSYGHPGFYYENSFFYYQTRTVTADDLRVAADWWSRERKQIQEAL